MKKLIPLFVALVTIIVSCSKKSPSNPGPDNKPSVTGTSDTLLTLNLSNENFVFYSSIYLVLSDETGEIINEVKYTSGPKDLIIISPKPYKKDRLNFFLIGISNDISIARSVIRGFLQIKKGSHYNTYGTILPSKTLHELEYHLKKTIPFNELDINGDNYGIDLKELSDTIGRQYPTLSDDSKLLTLLQTNGHHFYNLFDIPRGTRSFDVDMTQISKILLAKNITSPGTNLSVQIFGRADKKYSNCYNFGQVTSINNQLTYYYPQESFDEYVTEISYTIGKLHYSFGKNTNNIPDKADIYDAVINTPASNLATFKPSFSGDVDYYQASFSSTSNPSLIVLLYGPAAANYNNIKFPDFSKYEGIKDIDLTKQTLTSFSIFQDSNFDEKDLVYKFSNSFSYPNLNLKSVSKDY